MNIAFFLVPKLRVLWLSTGATVRDALRAMRRHGRSTAPVLDAQSGFAGTVSARSLTRFLRGHDARARAATSLDDAALVRASEPVGIDADVEQLVDRAVDQSFVPVVDDRRVFIGVVPRRAILKHALRRA